MYALFLRIFFSMVVCTQKAEETRRNSKPSGKREDQAGDAFLASFQNQLYLLSFNLILKV